MKIYGRFVVVILTVMLSTGVFAQSRPRNYSQEHPLIYEDANDFWPYSFTNEKGEPDGFNIDLIRMIFEELRIPYVIKLKPSQQALEDLRENRSDLTLGIADGFHDKGSSLYGKNPVLLLTQSVVTPKKNPVEIFYLRDLGQHQVIVCDSSFCHHLMIYYQWEGNAILSKDISESIQEVSNEEKGQIVWNSLSLKWLLHKYRIDNLELTPVNMPHGEYKFMSHNPQLLHSLDSIYAVLYSDEKLTALQNKWFYPEHNDVVTPTWVWYVVSATGLLAFLFLIYSISYRLRGRAINHKNNTLNKRLALIIETCKVRMWTYDVDTQLFTWRNENGQPGQTYTAKEFSRRYHPEDFSKLMEIIHKLEHTNNTDEEEKEVTLDIEAIDTESGDANWRDFTITLSVLRRDKNGRPSIIIGTKKDVTEEHHLQQLKEEQEMRYWSAFENPIIGILLFDRDGYLTNINRRACNIFCCDHDEMIAEHVTYQDLLSLKDIDMNDADGYHCTQEVDIDNIPPKQRKIHSCRRQGMFYNEIRLSTIRGEQGKLLGMFAFCRDISLLHAETEQLNKTAQEVARTEKELNDYINAINFILDKGNIRLVSYSPTSHTLTIFRHIDDIQFTLTQARCMTLVDNQHHRKAMHLLGNMDDCLNKNMEADIKTTIRGTGGLTLSLCFRLYPVKNRSGQVTEYFGLCLDVSEERKAESLMVVETLKAQEIENTQNKFLRNMMQEIRTPLSIVMKQTSKLNAEHRQPSEEYDIQVILANSQRLLQLINNILYMSRLEAHMVEIKKEPSDFASIFESHCRAGWSKYKKPEVRYIVENPYEKLVVNIDVNNLGQVIERVMEMSARNTIKGTIRARYDYIGRKLMISVDDTGEGIDPEELHHIQTEYSKGSQSSKTLGLSICKELIDQMGGTLEVNSEKGLGTTMWITLPCQASVIKRRKMK